MVFHGSMLVFQGSRLVFMGPCWFIMVPGGFLWFFMVPDGFKWFFMVPGWFFMVPNWFSWFFTVPGRFHGFSCFQVDFSFFTLRTPLNHILARRSSLGLAGVGWLWPVEHKNLFKIQSWLQFVGCHPKIGQPCKVRGRGHNRAVFFNMTSCQLSCRQVPSRKVVFGRKVGWHSITTSRRRCLQQCWVHPTKHDALDLRWGGNHHHTNVDSPSSNCTYGANLEGSSKMSFLVLLLQNVTPCPPHIYYASVQ